MSKINLFIKYCLINEKKEYNIKGIYQNNKIIFKDFDTLMIVNLDSNVLERKKDDSNIIFDFNKKMCFINNNNIQIDLKLNIIEFKKNNTLFYVKYKIENDEFEFKLEIL